MNGKTNKQTNRDYNLICYKYPITGSRSTEELDVKVDIQAVIFSFWLKSVRWDLILGKERSSILLYLKGLSL